MSKHQPKPLYMTKETALEIAKEWDTGSLMDKSLKYDLELIQDYLKKKEFDIPQVGGMSGSQIFVQHKQNVNALVISSRLFLIFEKEEYLYITKTLLMAYAKLYPTLDHVPSVTPNPLGYLGSQTLEDQVLGCSMAEAYGNIASVLTEEQQLYIETRLFDSMVKCFTEERSERFDFLHNLGMWACVSVGLMGLVMGNEDYVEKSLYGLQKDGKKGFLKQVEFLFSSDAYYSEGPFYQRYAIYPLFLFSQALDRAKPEIKMSTLHNNLVPRSFITLTDTAYENGKFIHLNDAFRHTGLAVFTDSCTGLMIGNAVSFSLLDQPKRCLEVAHLQQYVLINGYGLTLSKAYDSYDNKQELSTFSFTSKNFKHGQQGTNGGVSVIRSRSLESNDLTTISLDYGVHGLGHGHFDALNIVYHNHEHQVLRDYGCSRWNSIEYKFRGMYTVENETYVKQTVAHNTVVVDEYSHFNGDYLEADKQNGELLFSNYEEENLQYVAGKYDYFAKGVKGKRAIITWKNDDFEDPLILDFFSLESNEEHLYDLPFHYQGQFVHYSQPFNITGSTMQTLGDKQGYQHLWKEASSDTSNETSPLFSWLYNQRLYSVISTAKKGSSMVMGRVGANDPNFNLRAEPFYMLRQRGTNHTFVNVIESHSYWHEGAEVCTRSGIAVTTKVEKIYEDTQKVVAILHSEHKKWQICLSFDGSESQTHNITSTTNESISWKGHLSIQEL